jgi:hypothetical protein
VTDAAMNDWPRCCRVAARSARWALDNMRLAVALEVRLPVGRLVQVGIEGRARRRSTWKPPFLSLRTGSSVAAPGVAARTRAPGQCGLRLALNLAFAEQTGGDIRVLR